MEGGKMMSSTTSPDDSKEDDGGKVVLPGFRFHPTDEELVGFYLRRKVEKKTLRIELIKQVDVYKYDPWDLPRVSTVGDKEGYFFCIRGRKYRNSIRPNRVTGSGFWKATGIDKQIYSTTTTTNNGSATATDQYCIGLKKSLVYYRGCAGKGTKTDWMMHEFRLPPSCQNDNQPQEAEVWTLCRIFKRNASYSYVKYKAAEWKLKENDDHSITKQSPSDHSKTCSMESVTTHNNDHGQLVNFGDTRMVQQNERKPVIEGNYVGHESLLAPFVTTTPYSSCWNLINRDGDHHHYHHEQLFREGNWDELRSVVDRAGY